MATAEVTAAIAIVSEPTVVFPATVLPKDWTVAKLQEHLGGIPLERIRLYPPPGMATEQDVLQLDDHRDLLCELIDGILVEKPMGWFESRIAAVLIYFLEVYLSDHDIGITITPDGPIRLMAGQVRMPDVSFIRHEVVPPDETDAPRILPVAPDLAVEILSKSNTRAEMERKRAEYFRAGVKLVWMIHPKEHTATVYTSPDVFSAIPTDGALTGGDVLPGFELSLVEFFARVNRKRQSS